MEMTSFDASGLGSVHRFVNQSFRLNQYQKPVNRLNNKKPRSLLRHEVFRRPESFSILIKGYGMTAKVTFRMGLILTEPFEKSRENHRMRLTLTVCYGLNYSFQMSF